MSDNKGNINIKICKRKRKEYLKNQDEYDTCIKEKVEYFYNTFLNKDFIKTIFFKLQVYI